jgi:hypothetical protein
LRKSMHFDVAAASPPLGFSSLRAHHPRGSARFDRRAARRLLVVSSCLPSPQDPFFL